MQLIYLADFYTQMRMLRETRCSIVSALHSDQDQIDDQYIIQLKRTEDQLRAIPKKNGLYQLKTCEDDEILLELDYELSELEKDRIYLEQGQKALEDHLANIHTDFKKQVKQGVEFLNNKKFDHFITDRDGTIANYCGRYQSSIQPIYNAIFLSDFAKKISGKSVILTSAPLYHIGLLEISVQPKEDYVLAGSKGREFVDVNGDKFQYPIEEKQQKKLEQLNEAIEKILEKKEFSAFRYIGSGLQHKFGQTTLARQDKNKSIPEERSQQLKQSVEQLLKNLDPDGQFFRLEDTGKDLEIMLTVKKDKQKEVEDFNKGHGVKFIAKKLKLETQNKKMLICGDTASDLPILQAAKDLQADVTCIFVTTDDALKKEVREICPDAFIVSTPDVLVTLLQKYATSSTFDD